jgi:hypothetical protein
MLAHLQSLGCGLLVSVFTEVANAEVEQIKDKLSRVILGYDNQLDLFSRPTAV